ncbi:MAG TPA: molecular chaperone TorD family protein [Spirochaetia bacterium]|nr:molecular chaperone TorD family protein [Spirochaetia bacterium]
MDRLLELFAGIFNAPQSDLAAQVRECAQCAAAVGVPVDGLREFESFVQSAPREKLAELYSEETSLVGRQLYGDGYGRSMFILDLQKRYRRHGFETGDEPADHLAVILRFLSECEEPEDRRELIQDVLLPALDAMIRGEAPGDDQPRTATPFAPLLRALADALREEVSSSGT